MGINMIVFGSSGGRSLPPGWTSETSIAVLGSANFDLTGVEPGEGARLTGASIVGSINIIADDSTNVELSGFSLFGSRHVKLTGGDGPTIRVRGIALFGSVNVIPPNRA